MLNIPRYHVAAGSYHAGASQRLRLHALLGTCVGVALYDAKAKVGGLLHLLLPEPVIFSDVNQPERYASTGVPRFIRAICDAGASRKDLKACVAGGALVGPLNQQDLDLDIGGRTSEKVCKILTAEGIEIETMETGGFFTCSLELDMSSFQCTIEPAGFAKLTHTEQVVMPQRAEIEDSLESLQPIPQVVLKLLRIMDEGSSSIDRIAREVRKDQVISARTLQLANSATFIKKRRVESLDHALVFLGEDLLVKLIISAAVQNFFDRSQGGYSLCKGGIYHHVIGTALIAEKLAKFTAKVDSAKAYTAGLLHDIGKVVLDQYIDSTYPLFYRQLQEEDNHILRIEKKLFGIDHTEVGHLLAVRWGLPQSIIETVTNHHTPGRESRENNLVLIVNIADLLMSRFNSGLELERMDTQFLARNLETLGISTDRFAELIDIIPRNVFEAIDEQSEINAGTNSN
jgi:putative nucleotidyltransferase with HDIG domain